MKRLVSILCLAAALVSPLASASARENGRDRGGWAGAQRNDRGGPPAWAGAGRNNGVRENVAARNREDRGNQGRGNAGREDRGNSRNAPGRNRGVEDRGPPTPERQYRNVRPEVGGAGPRYGRGDYLPDIYQNDRVPNPESYHLRAPPYGFSWVRVGDSIVLMQLSTGRILESVPGGDAPPPRGRR